MCIWPNEKIALRWWSQIRLTREEVKFKHTDFKGANPPHACSPGHLTSFHLTCRPEWPYLFNLPTSRDGCIDRDSLILSFAISSVSCPEEMLEEHPLSWWLLGLWGFVVSLRPGRSCHVLPYLCHPLPLATLSDSVGLIFSPLTSVKLV